MFFCRRFENDTNYNVFVVLDSEMIQIVMFFCPRLEHGINYIVFFGSNLSMIKNDMNYIDFLSPTQALPKMS